MRKRTVCSRSASASLPRAMVRLAVRQLNQSERRRRPAHVHLSRHDLRQGRRLPAGGDRSRRQIALLDQSGHDGMGGGAVGGVGDGLAGGIPERLDRRGGKHIEVHVGEAGLLRADDAHRRALRIGAEHAHHAGCNADIDAAGNHRLLGFSATLGVEDVEIQTVLLEDPRSRSDLGNRGVPPAALSDCKLQLVLRTCRRMAGGLKNQDGETKNESGGFH
jgi:hypothetical protein